MTQVASRRRPERGAVLAEFALVAPLLFCLLLGMITGGVAFDRKLAVTNGVREGSRFGATLPVASAASCTASTAMDCWLANVASVTQQASEGQLGSTVPTRSVCVAYVYPSGTATNDRTRRLVRTAGGDTYSNATCFSDGRASSERRVQVSGSRQAQIEWIFGASTVTLASESVTKFEAVQ